MSSSKQKHVTHRRDGLRWWALIIHSLAWVGLGIMVGLVAQGLAGTSVSAVLGYALGGLFAWFACALILLLVIYHVPDLSRWAIAIPFMFSLVVVTMALSLIGFDGRDQTRATLVVIFWLLMMIAAFILPLIGGGELRPVRALMSAVIILVGAPVVSGVLFLAGIMIYGVLNPMEYEILPIEALFVGLVLCVAVVPTLIGVFLIRQIKVTRGAWMPVSIQWRSIGSQVTSYRQRLRWVFIAGHFCAWLVLAGMAMVLFSGTSGEALFELRVMVGIALLVLASAITTGLVSIHLRLSSWWFVATPVIVLAVLMLIGMATVLIMQEERNAFYMLIFGGMLVCAIGFIFPLIALGELRWQRALILVVGLMLWFSFGLSAIASGWGWVLVSLFYGDAPAGVFLMGLAVALAVVSTTGSLLIIQQGYASRRRKALPIDANRHVLMDMDGELTQDMPQ